MVWQHHAKRQVSIARFCHDRQDSFSAGLAHRTVLHVKITVQRRLLTPQSTEGDLYLDGGWEAYTLEPRDIIFAPRIDEVSEKPYAIPSGSY